MRLNLDFKLADKWKADIKAAIDEINNDAFPLVLFGNVYFDSIVSVLKKMHVDICYMCDNNPEQKKTPFYGCKGILPAELDGIYGTGEYNVLILVPFEEEITAQLNGLPKPPKKIFHLDLYFNQEDNAKFIRDHLDRFNEVYTLLSDEKSRKTFQNMLNYRMCRDSSFLKAIAYPRATQYFSKDITDFNDHETFIDCGAYIGDTIAKFIDCCNGVYHEIYAFEPELNNYKKLQKFAERDRNIHTFPFGISDREKIGYTSSFGMHSSIGETGDEAVRTDSIDHVLSQAENPDATFIKMDIEGYECKALKGAKNTIRQYKPKLAICMYHSIEDMVNVPLLIHELEPGYSLYIRHYSQGIVETVCYAIYNR